MKKLFFIFLMVFCFASKALCFPALTGRVVDEANLLTPSQKEQLEQLLVQAEPHQVVAVSLQSLDGQEIEEYGYQLGRHWGIGRKGIDDGVLVLIAPEQRQLRIEVGYGLEGTLTDAVCSQIVNHIMLPLARQGKYDEALIQGATKVIQIITDSANASTITGTHVSEGAPMTLLDGILFVLLFLSMLSVPFLFWGLIFLRVLYYNSYKKNSAHNRKLFFYENVVLNNGLLTMLFLIWATERVVIWLIPIILGFVWINWSNLRRWRKNPRFPYKPQWSNLQIGSSSGSDGHSGSSFSGGGGSFGGGGSSGRF